MQANQLRELDIFQSQQLPFHIHFDAFFLNIGIIINSCILIYMILIIFNYYNGDQRTTFHILFDVFLNKHQYQQIFIYYNLFDHNQLKKNYCDFENLIHQNVKDQPQQVQSQQPTQIHFQNFDQKQLSGESNSQEISQINKQQKAQQLKSSKKTQQKKWEKDKKKPEEIKKKEVTKKNTSAQLQQQQIIENFPQKESQTNQNSLETQQVKKVKIKKKKSEANHSFEQSIKKDNDQQNDQSDPSQQEKNVSVIKDDKFNIQNESNIQIKADQPFNQNEKTINKFDDKFFSDESYENLIEQDQLLINEDNLDDKDDKILLSSNSNIVSLINFKKDTIQDQSFEQRSSFSQQSSKLIPTLEKISSNDNYNSEHKKHKFYSEDNKEEQSIIPQKETDSIFSQSLDNHDSPLDQSNSDSQDNDLRALFFQDKKNFQVKRAITTNFDKINPNYKRESSLQHEFNFSLQKYTSLDQINLNENIRLPDMKDNYSQKMNILSMSGNSHLNQMNKNIGFQLNDNPQYFNQNRPIHNMFGISFRPDQKIQQSTLVQQENNLGGFFQFDNDEDIQKLFTSSQNKPRFPPPGFK